MKLTSFGQLIGGRYFEQVFCGQPGGSFVALKTAGDHGVGSAGERHLRMKLTLPITTFDTDTV